MNGDDQKQPVTPQDSNQWHYIPEASAPIPSAPQSPSDPYTSASLPEVSWTASEFVAHAKGFEWYAFLGLGSVALAAIVYLITKDIPSVIIILFVTIIFGIAAVRKPRVLTYSVNNHGLTIAQKYYPYANFKSFSVMEEGAFSSITFLPLQRFMPPISIYYEPKDEDRIMSVLSQFLPLEHREYDMIDRFIRSIHF